MGSFRIFTFPRLFCVGQLQTTRIFKNFPQLSPFLCGCTLLDTGNGRG
jgi:hypothetical protein